MTNLLDQEKVGNFPAGYFMSITGRGVRKVVSGKRVYTLRGAKRKLLVLLVMCTVAYFANFAFAFCNGGQENEDMRLLAGLCILLGFILVCFFGYFSTLTKTTRGRSGVFAVGVITDICLASFLGMLSAGAHGFTEMAYVVLPFALAGFVCAFAVDWIVARVKAVWAVSLIITPLVVIPFWLFSLFFGSFKPGMFAVGVVMCAVSVFSFTVDLMTMKYFAERGDVDAAYEWFTAIIAVLDLFIAVGGLGGAVGATQSKKS